jgi:hypothetical protein
MIEAGITQGLLGFVLYLGAVAVLLRVARRTEPALLVVAAALVCCFLTLAVLLGIGLRVNFWEYATSYWFFALCFLMAFGAIYKSISLRILLDLSMKPGRADDYDSMLARYIAEESYQNRLRVIQDKRLAARVGDRFVLTDRGRLVARSVRAIQEVFRITRSG